MALMESGGLAENIGYRFLLLCVALLSVHLRTGAGSEHLDFNIIAAASRAILWFAILCVIGVIKPSLLFVRFVRMTLTGVISFMHGPFLFSSLVSTVYFIVLWCWCFST